MAATNYSPISLYYSTTTGAVPLAANLVSGELAINVTDGVLFYKDNAGVVQTLATKAATSGTYTSITITGGTANGVGYLNGSKQFTTGSALTFDGAGNFFNSASGAGYWLSAAGTYVMGLYQNGTSLTFRTNTTGQYTIDNSGNSIWSPGGTEQMRLTSTGLGIGTSSPGAKVEAAGASTNDIIKLTRTGSAAGSGFIYANANDMFGVHDGTRYPFQIKQLAPTGSLTLDSSGNLGLGVTPSSSLGGWKSFEVGATGSQFFVNTAGNDWHLSNNAYYSSGWKRGTANPATDYEQNAGSHIWYTAPSGNANDPITFTQAMTLDASGNLGIGTSSPGAKLDVVGNATVSGGITSSGGDITVGTAGKFLYSNYVSQNSGNSLFLRGAGASGQIEFQTNTTTKATLDSSGNLGLGVTPSAWASTYKAFQVLNVGRSLAATGAGAGDLTLAFNAIYSSANSRWDYAYTGDAAVRYSQTGAGIHAWYTAPSGTAGNAISFTQAMTLDSSGNLGIGTTSAAQRLDVSSASTSDTDLKYNFVVRSTDAYSTTPQAGIAFATYFNGTQNLPLAGIYGGKENTTLDDFASKISFATRANGGNITERARIDSSGNLGLGVTPSAWGQGTAFEMYQKGYGLWNGSGNPSSIYMLANTYFNGGFKYANTGGYASSYYQYNGQHVWSTAPSGNAGDAISFTQAMTLDASGNLGVGETSMGTIRLVIRKDDATAYSTSNMGAQTQTFLQNTTKGGYSNLILGCTSATSGSSAYAGIAVVSEQASDTNGALAFGTRPSGGGNITERARIDSSGNLLVGTTTNIRTSKFVVGGAFGGGTGAEIDNDSSTSWISLAFHTAGTLVGYISNTTSATSYNTSSDYRLKNNQQPLTGSGAFIDALQPKTWEWKADGSKGVGFIAHEVQAVSPGSVVGEKDAVDEDGKPKYQAMEYGSAEFIANIIAELQSVRKRLAALEGK